MHKWDYGNRADDSLDYLRQGMWNVVTVVDQMAQSIEHETCRGCSPEAIHMLHGECAERRRGSPHACTPIVLQACDVNQWLVHRSRGIMIWSCRSHKRGM